LRLRPNCKQIRAACRIGDRGAKAAARHKNKTDVAFELVQYRQRFESIRSPQLDDTVAPSCRNGSETVVRRRGNLLDARDEVGVSLEADHGPPSVDLDRCWALEIPHVDSAVAVPCGY